MVSSLIGCNNGFILLVYQGLLNLPCYAWRTRIKNNGETVHLVFHSRPIKTIFNSFFHVKTVRGLGIHFRYKKPIFSKLLKKMNFDNGNKHVIINLEPLYL